MTELVKEKKKKIQINCDSRALIPKELSLKRNKMIPLKWKVVEHQKNGVLSWDPKKIDFFVCKEQEEESISAKKLQKIFKRKKVKLLNSKVLDFLVKHQELIPESWKEEVVVFWGTIYKGPNGQLYVRTLEWRIDKYADSYMWVSAYFGKHEPAAIWIG